MLTQKRPVATDGSGSRCHGYCASPARPIWFYLDGGAQGVLMRVHRLALAEAVVPYFGCYQITSRGSDLHPPAAPPGERYALSREERAGTHRISRLLIERTIPAICVGLCRFCNVIAPSRGRITRIQCRQVGMSSATNKEARNRNERARNQAALHQRPQCDHFIHVHGPLGNNVPDPVQSTEPDQ